MKKIIAAGTVFSFACGFSVSFYGIASVRKRFITHNNILHNILSLHYEDYGGLPCCHFQKE